MGSEVVGSEVVGSEVVGSEVVGSEVVGEGVGLKVAPTMVGVLVVGARVTGGDVGGRVGGEVGDVVVVVMSSSSSPEPNPASPEPEPSPSSSFVSSMVRLSRLAAADRRRIRWEENAGIAASVTRRSKRKALQKNKNGCAQGAGTPRENSPRGRDARAVAVETSSHPPYLPRAA